MTVSKENQAPFVDWGKIHTQLDNVRERLEKGWQLTVQEKKHILAVRAKALASPLKEEPLKQDRISVTEFMLDEERYGIELDAIVEVYDLKDLTALPSTPPFILGIINVRGEILTVIDIKKLFDLPDKGLNDLNKVIIVNAHGMVAGILADVITGVRSIPLINIQQAPPTITGIRAEYMKGVTGDQLIILNVENIFSDEKMIVNEGF